MVYYCTKGCFVVNCQIGEDATVKLNACLVQSVDQTAVGQALYTGLGVDSRNPQSTECTFLSAAVTVSVLTRLGNCLSGNSVYTTPCAVITFCLLEDFLVTTACFYTTFYSSHFSLLPVSY